MGKEEKLLLKYFFAALLAFAMFYTVLTRSSFYDEDGLPVAGIQNDTLKISGENIAGSYALLRLFESGKSPEEVYNPEIQTDFVKNVTGANGVFRSFSAPTLPLVIVPFSELAYGEFYSMWLTWGLFFFSASLLLLFPFVQAVLLSFAFPALFYAFSFGGGGLFYVAALIFLLTKADKFPKTAGFIGGLSFVSPFYGSACVVALFLKKCKAAAFLALAFGGFIVAGAFSRYGAGGFLEAFEGGISALKENPCDFASVIGASACSGASPVLALVFQIFAIVLTVVAAFGIFKRKTAKENVKNAFFCAAVALCFPMFEAAQYAVLCASSAFLICDVRERGSSGIFEKAVLLSVFLAPYADPFFAVSFGFSVIPVIAAGLAFVCRERSF